MVAIRFDLGVDRMFAEDMEAAATRHHTRPYL
jgi:hypothetical protein